MEVSYSCLSFLSTYFWLLLREGAYTGWSVHWSSLASLTFSLPTRISRKHWQKSVWGLKHSSSELCLLSNFRNQARTLLREPRRVSQYNHGILGFNGWCLLAELTFWEIGDVLCNTRCSWKTCQHWLQTRFFWLLDHIKYSTVKCTGNVIVRLVRERTELNCCDLTYPRN